MRRSRVQVPPQAPQSPERSHRSARRSRSLRRDLPVVRGANCYSMRLRRPRDCAARSAGPLWPRRRIDEGHLRQRGDAWELRVYAGKDPHLGPQALSDPNGLRRQARRGGRAREVRDRGRRRLADRARCHGLASSWPSGSSSPKLTSRPRRCAATKSPSAASECSVEQQVRGSSGGGVQQGPPTRRRHHL
jgi:hypothetical protein